MPQVRRSARLGAVGAPQRSLRRPDQLDRARPRAGHPRRGARAPGVAFVTVWDMTRMYGKPGGHAIYLARQAILRLLGWAAASATCGLLTYIIWNGVYTSFRVPALLAGTTGFLSTAWQARNAKVDFMRAYTGATAEQFVAKTLRRGRFSAVVNGALLQRGDADHVAIGPALAVIETKHGRGRVTAGDRFRVGHKTLPRDPVSQVSTQAEQLGRMVGRVAVPVVCVTNMYGPAFQTRGVWVTSAAGLLDVLRSLPGQLNDEEATRIAERIHAISEENKRGKRPERTGPAQRGATGSRS